MFATKLINGTCHVNYDPKLNCIIMDWKGYSTSEEFRLTNEEILAFFIAKKADKILADTSELLIIDGHDQQWLSSDWIPRAIKSGFKACAMIEPKHHFNKVAIENITNHINDQLSVSFFNNRVQAKAWLQQLTA
jgi:hypothetical protein